MERQDQSFSCIYLDITQPVSKFNPCQCYIIKIRLQNLSKEAFIIFKPRCSLISKLHDDDMVTIVAAYLKCSYQMHWHRPPMTVSFDDYGVSFLFLFLYIRIKTQIWCTQLQKKRDSQTLNGVSTTSRLALSHFSSGVLWFQINQFQFSVSQDDKTKIKFCCIAQHCAVLRS